MVVMFERIDLILPEAPFDGPMQMALDEALLREVSQPTLRIYRWKSPCATFGYFQRHAEVRVIHPELPITRRWTGGGIVEHGLDMTFSLCIPRNHPTAVLPPALFYRNLHSKLLPWIGRTVSGVRLASKEEISSGVSCFTAPAPDDLLDGGVKILGGAQRRSGGALLYQGSLKCDQVGWDDPCGMAGALAPKPNPRDLGDSLLGLAIGIARNRYGNHEWTLRR